MITPALSALPQRFWEKVDQRGDCWVWVGAVTSRGYGSAAVTGDGKTSLAHRAAFEDLRGPIPDGMTVDHLCRLRQCVNPAHMDIVTPGENARRGKSVITHCPRGHEYTDVNTRERNGWRSCRECDNTHRTAKASA